MICATFGHKLSDMLFIRANINYSLKTTLGLQNGKHILVKLPVHLSLLFSVSVFSMWFFSCLVRIRCQWILYPVTGLHVPWRQRPGQVICAEWPGRGQWKFSGEMESKWMRVAKVLASAQQLLYVLWNRNHSFLSTLLIPPSGRWVETLSEAILP